MTQLSEGDALIVVDMQKDFLPGGALPVPDGDAIVPVVNAYVARFSAQSLPIVFSRDWHPPQHCSFKAQGGPWPPHCVADTAGAEFAPGLTIPGDASIVSKAMRPDRDAYSAFEGTHLLERLRALNVRRVFVCGLATDYCVQATAQTALDSGLRTVVLQDAVRAVDVKRGDGEAALRALCARGAQLSELSQLNSLEQ